jgi:ankyrin repeat protein
MNNPPSHKAMAGQVPPTYLRLLWRNGTLKLLCLSMLLIGRTSFAMNSMNISGRADELIRAAHDGNLALVTKLLVAGVPIDAKGFDGATSLYMAACANRKNICELLIAHKADPYEKINSGWCPLSAAACHNNAEICTLLVDEMLKPIKRNRDVVIILLGLKKFGKVAYLKVIDKEIIRLLARQVFDKEKQKRLFAEINSISGGSSRSYFCNYARKQLSIKQK